MIDALINGNPDSVTSRFPLMMLPAFAACYACGRFEVPGLLTCFQLAAFAVSGATFREFRSERGLWMLAMLFFLIWVAISMMWMYGEACDWVRGVAPPVTLLADATIATFVMRTHTVFLWKTAKVNYSLTRSQA